MSGHLNLGYAFIVGDVPRLDLEEITVPVTEDFIEWDCKLRLL